MPAVVEAYLNGGLIGVVLVMGMFGVGLALFDQIVRRAATAPVALGVYAFAVWRLVNIEHNAFINLIPIIKVIALLVAIASVYTVLARSLRPRPIPLRAAAP
jgi:O-antigen ligase